MKIEFKNISKSIWEFLDFVVVLFSRWGVLTVKGFNDFRLSSLSKISVFSLFHKYSLLPKSHIHTEK